MSDLQVGEQAPDFSLPRDGGELVTLDDFHGHFLILYFYPKDDTPGCTLEATEFSAMKSKIELINGRVLGVSKDTVAKHDKFIAKHDLTIPLISDAEGDMCEKYGVWVEKNMYGRKYFGIERATFLINPTGKIIHIWRKVRAKGHVEAVFKELKSHAE